MNLKPGQEVYTIVRDEDTIFWKMRKGYIFKITETSIVVKYPNDILFEVDKCYCNGTLFETKEDVDRAGIKYLGGRYCMTADKPENETKSVSRSDINTVVDKINNMQREIYDLLEALCLIKHDIQNLLEEESYENTNN